MKLRTLLASVIGLLTCCHLVSAQRLSNGGLSFQTYEKSSKPVLDYYRQTKLLKVVNGENSISQINNEISGLIDSIKG